MRNNNEFYRPTLRQGDIVLVDYGKGSGGCRTRGTKPSIVVSNNKTLNEEGVVNVIPLFRSPSKAFKAEDIMIAEKDCRGLRYDEYVQPFQMQLVPRYRIKRHIGSLKDKKSIFRITEAISNIVKAGEEELR